MSMDPVLTKEKIRSDYYAYLQSLLTVRSKLITPKARDSLKGSSFVKGPYLEATPPFTAGKSLKELREEGVVSPEFAKIAQDVHESRPLYSHQEAAIRKLCVEGANAIVATGTGSGKTECYLLPIFNELMREKEHGTLDSGVRALLLFPMNALANDQLKKLRQLLGNYPDITFGRYTGETPNGSEENAHTDYRIKYGESALPNEMLSRRRMRETPPHILLTNYAMLEYLLLRPEDSEFFDGPSAHSWKFIVIDEAHTYKGTNGSEIAMLLRRVKERIARHSDCHPRCIATSATLGSMVDGKALSDFASDIFGEPFRVQDIVTSTRVLPQKTAEMHNFSLDEYLAIREKLAKTSEETRGATAYDMLKSEARLVSVHDLLIDGPKDFDQVADRIFEDLLDTAQRKNALACLVELASMAKPDDASAALLSARYHLFVKSMEGMFASFYPKVQVFLDRKEHIWENGREISVFEMANCQHCSQEYIIGKIENGYLRQQSQLESPEYFLLDSGEETGEFDADEDDDEEHADAGKLERMALCACCGRIRPCQDRSSDCCENPDSGKLRTVYRVAYDRKNDTSNICPKCGATGKGILKRFLTANHAATFTLAESLYGMIPPRKLEMPSQSDDDLFDMEPDFFEKNATEQGRKLLIFSDNRQEAAFFAGYMDNRHRMIMWQRMMLRILSRKEDPISIKELADELVIEADRDGIQLDRDGNGRDGERKSALKMVMREFLMLDRATGMEGRGYLEFFPEEMKLRGGKFGLDANETWNLLRFLMDTLRQSGAVAYPDNISPEDDFFAPRNHPAWFREDTCSTKYGQKILSILPSPGRKNKRSMFVRKLLAAQGNDSEEAARDALQKMAAALMKMKDYGYISGDSFRSIQRYALNVSKWRVRAIPNDGTLYRCESCGMIFSYSILGQCPEYRCHGALKPIPAEEARSDPYYSQLYAERMLLPMVCREHTAQLSTEAAGDYQKDFESGKINVLSCSTTFEMGVDVGELEATFLRNVPPETSNYIQRAGRAGRRASSSAFAVTFARRNSHDLNFFQCPENIISGKIRPPYIEIGNEKVVVRHIHSIVFAWLFSRHPDYFSGGAGMFSGYGNTENALDVLKRELAQKPEALKSAVAYMVPIELHQRLGVTDWSFADELTYDDGALSRTIAQRKAELDELAQMKKTRDQENRSTEGLRRLINTRSSERVLSFLSSSGILPKYGFPVDVVNLSILSNSEEAARVDLSRDLRMAIGEYAPPSSIVANGRVWMSYALNTVPSKAWPEHFYYGCPNGHIAFPENDTHDKEALEPKQCFCGATMKIHQYVIPIFGFSTSFDAKEKKVGAEKPTHSYATRVQFRGIGELDSYQQKERKTEQIILKSGTVIMEYSPNGEMVVLNQGRNNAGLWICTRCGYVSEIPKKERHKNKFGNDCANSFMSNLSLGHSYKTDILRIELPAHYMSSEKDQQMSVMYALLEGASETLSIARDDIDGCVDASTNNVILFDVVAGGAGHVKRISDHFRAVLENAIKRVDGRCGCSEETSCYGCLRNYGNQYVHDRLSRGLAYNYLQWLCIEME